MARLVRLPIDVCVVYVNPEYVTSVVTQGGGDDWYVVVNTTEGPKSIDWMISASSEEHAEKVAVELVEWLGREA